ncbi:hypothetical protein P9B04_14985, partial [Crocosphaera sp. Alani8]
HPDAELRYSAGLLGGELKRRQEPTVIHVNKGLIGSNNKKDEKKPVIIVRKGTKTTYCSEVSFNGKCKIIYRPDNETRYGSPKVWIEVNAGTKISMKSETIIVKNQVNRDSNVPVLASKIDESKNPRGDRRRTFQNCTGR